MPPPSKAAIEALQNVNAGKTVRFSCSEEAFTEAAAAGLIERVWKVTEKGWEVLKAERVKELLCEKPEVVEAVRVVDGDHRIRPCSSAMDRYIVRVGYAKDGYNDDYGCHVSDMCLTALGRELLAAWSEVNVAKMAAQRETDAKIEAALRWVCLHRNGQLGTIFKHREQPGLQEAAEAGLVHETSAAASMWVSITDAGRIWLGERSPEDTVPCGFFGCAMPRSKKAILCDSCEEERRKDPEAFK